MLRRLLVTLALATGFCIVPTPSTTLVHADQGLTIESTTTYTVDGASGIVHVAVDLTLTNTSPDVVRGFQVFREYFSAFQLPAPVASANVAARAGGRPLGVTTKTVPDAPDLVLYVVELPNRLFYRQTTQITATYDITGLAPRSKNPWRVNPAYAAFEAFGIGDAGKVNVRVVVPDGFVVDMLGSTTTVGHENGNVVYTAANIPNPTDFDILVSARNDAALVSRPVTTANADAFSLRSWPGDTAWADFVATQIHDGVPELATLIGQKWPISGTLDVLQAYTPYLYGYAGWFSATSKRIEIGEDLDQEVVLHELSHAWFSENWFSDRWLDEGLAQVYSNKAVDDLGGTGKRPDAINTSAPGHISLNDWSNPTFTDGTSDTEAYGYNAAFEVTQQIVDEVGVDKMKAVFGAIADHTISYVGDVSPESQVGATDWRRFLDLVEQIGGSTKAGDLLRQYVLRTSDVDSLGQRATARDAYHALAAKGGAWAPPIVVRRAMSIWNFPAATAAMADATRVLTMRDTLDIETKRLGVTAPSHFESDYEETDTDFAKLTAAVQDEIDTARVVNAASDAIDKGDDLLGSVGLWGTHLSADLDAAKASFVKGDNATARATARKIIDTVAHAPSVGTRRVLWTAGGLLLFVLLVLAIVALARRRRRRLAPDAELPAAEPTDGDAVDAQEPGPVDVQDDPVPVDAPIDAPPA